MIRPELIKAIYFQEPVDQFSCVERAWRNRVDADRGRAIFLRSRPGHWSAQTRSWSIKYILEGHCDFEVKGRWCEVYEGFCFVIPEGSNYRSTLRDGKAISVFGRALTGVDAEPGPKVMGVFALSEGERRALDERLAVLQRLGEDSVGVEPDQGIEILLDQPFPLPRTWTFARASVTSWLRGSATRQRSAERLILARHHLTAGFRRHDICARAAEQANMERSHFSRQFSALFGESPRDYVVAYRSAVAQRLLDSGRHTVEQVASHLGYGHPSSLTHLFQRHQLGNPRNRLGGLRRGDSR